MPTTRQTINPVTRQTKMPHIRQTKSHIYHSIICMVSMKPSFHRQGVLYISLALLNCRSPGCLGAHLYISLPVDGKGSLEGFGCVRAGKTRPAGPKGPQQARRARTRARRAREGERSETVVPEAVDYTYKMPTTRHAINYPSKAP